MRPGVVADDGYNPGGSQGDLAPLDGAQGLPATQRPARGSERFANAQNAAEQATVWWVRWSPHLAPPNGIRPSDTLVTESGARFDIKSVIELGRRDGLEIAGVTLAG